MTVTVTTQAELDAALAANEPSIYITSPDGVWLTLHDSGSSHVVARGSSHVVARGSSHVVAWESSHVVARESSHVVARESSHVEAWESSHVEARPYVAVHLHSARATVEGGTVIDVSALDLSDPTVWADYHGVEVTDGHAIVYKAVNDDLTSGRGLAYPVGKTVKVTAKEWLADGRCGRGLHFGPTPRHAKAYHAGATRYLACRIPLDAASVVTDGGTAKIKARSCEVLYEVDIDGNRVGVDVLVGAVKR